MGSIRSICTLIVLHLAVVLAVHAAPPPPDALIDEAWQAWEQGNQTTVEQKFRDAIQQQPTNPRPHLGLSFLYTLQRKYSQAWGEYQTALGMLPDRTPYLYAAWVTPKFRQNLGSASSGVLNLVEDLASKGDPTGVLKAWANETLLNNALDRDKLSQAHQYGRAMNCVTDWMVIGPYDNVSGSGYEKAYPPEGAYDPAGRYNGKNEIPTWWFKPAAVRIDNWIDFNNYFANSNSIFYANTFVYSPKQQTIWFRIGTSGSYKAFLNDELVNETDEEYNNDLDTYIAETRLEQGWNRVLVKCGYSELHSCNFLLRITDAAGNPIPDMQVSTDRHDYPSKPGAAAKRFENFAEVFFKQQIAEHPDQLENYLLLADCYLRNDKGIDAELILRKALEHSPNSPLLYDRLIEAYQRGNKDDEIERTLEHIYTIDKNVPSALEYKFGQFMKTEEYDKAEDVMNEFERLLPLAPQTYAMRVALYARKEMAEKVIETTQEAYGKYPRNPEFVMAAASIVAEAARRPQEAIKMLDAFLDDGLDVEVMQAEARLYLDQSDVKSWRKIYDKLLDMSPASPGYYHYMANVYFGMRDYDRAEEAIHHALDLCPSSPTLWAKLGEIHRIQGQRAEAIGDYKRALSYDPIDYDNRATLRELQAQRPIFEQFAPIDIDSVIEYAHTMTSDPDDGAVVVLDRAQHVIYEQGASESIQEMVVKVLNGRGIDDWKEYVMPVNRYHEELIVDKAVVVKRDGTERKADVDDGYVVFKALEENDVIHLKWHTKSQYSGKLASQFFDTYYFNGYYPAKHVSYELLAPKNFKFAYRTQRMSAEPEKREVVDGMLYRWSRNDIPAISHEYGMPTLEDVGALLYVSSIDSWQFFVDWYTDVATAKTKASFEIKEQVHTLLAGKESASDEVKMREIYNFITENIRYSSVAFRQGAFIPQKARDVLVNRIGDCKDVATLCIAMLREAGLEAHFVLVNTRDEGRNKNALPSVAFNHCIVAVETAGGLKYLDLTANNYPIGSVPDGDEDAFALVIKPGVKEPTYLPGGSIRRTATTHSMLKLGADNSLSGSTSTIGSGSTAASIREYFRDQPRKEQEKKLLAGLGSTYSGVKLSSLRFENIDNLEPNASYAYDFQVPNYLSEAGSFRILKIPWSHGEESDRALSYETREYPYDYSPGNDTLIEEVTLTIPDGYVPIELPAATTLTNPIADYSLSFTYTNGKLVARRRLVNKQRIVEVGDYQEFKAFHTNVVKEDERLILLQKKGGKVGR